MDGRYEQARIRFTASVMGNPEYLDAVKTVPQAKDERHVGIEKLNAFHAHAHRMRKERADVPR